jgi:hypothetical protein
MNPSVHKHFIPKTANNYLEEVTYALLKKVFHLYNYKLPQITAKVGFAGRRFILLWIVL